MALHPEIENWIVGDGAELAEAQTEVKGIFFWRPTQQMMVIGTQKPGGFAWGR